MRIPLSVDVSGRWSFQRMLKRFSPDQQHFLAGTVIPYVSSLTMNDHIERVQAHLDAYFEEVEEQILESFPAFIQRLIPDAEVDLEWADDGMLNITRQGKGQQFEFKFKIKQEAVLDITGPTVDAFLSNAANYARFLTILERAVDFSSRILHDFTLQESFHTANYVTHGFTKLRTSLQFVDPRREETKANIRARQQVAALQGVTVLPQDISFEIGKYLGMQPNTAPRSRPLPPALTQARLLIPFEERLARKNAEARRNLHSVRAASAAAAATRKPIPFAANSMKGTAKPRRTRRQRARRE